MYCGVGRRVGGQNTVSMVEVSMEMWFVRWYCSGTVISTRSVHKTHHTQHQERLKSRDMIYLSHISCVGSAEESTMPAPCFRSLISKTMFTIDNPFLSFTMQHHPQSHHWHTPSSQIETLYRWIPSVLEHKFEKSNYTVHDWEAVSRDSKGWLLNSWSAYPTTSSASARLHFFWSPSKSLSVFLTLVRIVSLNSGMESSRWIAPSMNFCGFRDFFAVQMSRMQVTGGNKWGDVMKMKKTRNTTAPAINWIQGAI